MTETDTPTEWPDPASIEKPPKLSVAQSKGWDLIVEGKLPDTEIADACGVSDRTVRNWSSEWRKRYRLDNKANRLKTEQARTQVAAEVTKRKWQEVREKEAYRFGMQAELVRSRLHDLLPRVGVAEVHRVQDDRTEAGGTRRDAVMVPVAGRDIKELALAIGILIDKADKLAGIETIERVDLTLSDGRKSELKGRVLGHLRAV